MKPEEAEHFFGHLAKEVPAAFTQALAAAAGAMRARPVFLQRQPFPKRAAAVRRALSRVAANPLAEELLAVYFLECRKPLLLEWLDGVGVAHEDGTLKEEQPPEPEAAALETAVATFREGEDAADRQLLLRAFAAQAAIDWPHLERLVGADA